ATTATAPAASTHLPRLNRIICRVLSVSRLARSWPRAPAVARSLVRLPAGASERRRLVVPRARMVCAARRLLDPVLLAVLAAVVLAAAVVDGGLAVAAARGRCRQRHVLDLVAVEDQLADHGLVAGAVEAHVDRRRRRR